MIRRVLLRAHMLAEPWLRHSNWMVRRPAQVAGLGIATIWLLLTRRDAMESWASDQRDELFERLSSSVELREFLHGPAIAKPFVGRICRSVVLRLSTVAKLRGRARSDGRNFPLRVDGPIDQKVLRNLLIWQNHVLPSYLRQEDSAQVDITLVLTNKSDNEPRFFDLLSVVLMLERFRSCAVFWDEEVAMETASLVMSERELCRWHAGGEASDLGKLPRAITGHVEASGTRGGVRLLAQGRKYANDFLKSALPGHFIVAVALHECLDGTVKPSALERWLSLTDTLRARRSDLAFVILNCLAPSQWQKWPAHVRFARHQGLSLQDAICLAQTADGFIGVLDIFGLAAHSAGRPGVYVPLEEGNLPRSEKSGEDPATRQVIVASQNRADIERAIESVFAVDRVF
jgi:hypothetical protein